MCGINGLITFNKQSPSKDLLKKMNDSMFHRGPDEEGYFVDERVGLSMRRLSILGLDDSSQPQYSKDENIVLIFNGEIYNFIEIRKELIEKGYEFKTTGDTEVLVHLYEEKGIDLLHDLNGMFTFAIYDKNKEKVFVARDRLGIKPLYLLKENEKLSFSSDLQSLTAGNPGFKKEIDDNAFISFLCQSFISNPTSIFKGINKLEPATYLEIDINNKKVTSQKYWNLEKFETLKVSESEYIDKLKDAMKSSISLRQRSDVPIGTFLSGGLDSSTIVALLKKSIGNEGELHTFSVGFEGGENELPLARLVSEKYSTTHYELLITDEHVKEILPNIVNKMDEPFFDNAMIPTYLLSQEAISKGIKVILNGTGGDEIFGGYSRYLPQNLNHKLILNSPQLFRSLGSMALSFINPNKSMMLKDQELFYMAQLSGVNYQTMFELFNDNNIVKSEVKRLIEKYRPYFKESRLLRRKYPLMKMDLDNYLVDDILNLLDKMTMGNSLEGRVPFLDHKVVELCYQIPDSVKLNGGLKGLMKKAFGDILPNDLLNVSKKGFGGPTNHWLKGPLVKMVYKELIENPIDYYKEKFQLSKIAEMFSSQKVKPEYTQTIFALYIFSLWYREHVMKDVEK
jgi:asparagine synthase (glutamine-hydrolysing)